MASFRVPPCGTGRYSVLQRYGSLVCNKHTTLAMPCGATKTATSLRSHFM
jgi:hypothetical protein